jgi:hypothetical protein
MSIRDVFGIDGLKAIAAAGVLTLAGASASAQLRIAAWNISNYSGGRDADLKTAIYGSFQGRSMSPDVIMSQEFLSDAAATSFLTILNTAPGSPGDWSRFTFVNGPDTDNAVFFRTSKLQPVVPAGVGDPDGFPDPILIVPGGNTSGAPRDVRRYDLRLVGYNAPSAVVALYPVHMKAGDSSTDQSRRLDEATKIRVNITTLPAGWQYIIAGDFNIQSSNQAAYQHMIGLPALGRVLDPISTPGSWNNNGAFRFVHTQDPAGAGGVDDRHDQILVSPGLLDAAGFDYIGAIGVPYSTTTWNDLNHTYRAWGNDGTSYNTTLTVAGNQMVGPTIAQALINICVGAGHLPVFLDARVPAKVTSQTTLNFGDVFVDDPAALTLNVSNAGDVAKWNIDGIATLSYSLAAPPGFSAPVGSFNDAPGGGVNSHVIAMDTSAPGDLSGTLVIASNDPDQPTRSVTLVGRVFCVADYDRSGFVDADDFDAFVVDFEAGDESADFDASGFVDGDDFDAFVFSFQAGC